MRSTTLIAPFTLAAAASASVISERQSACADTHIFLAKGNNEPYPGRQGKIVNAVCDGLASCDYEDIQYYNVAGYNYCAGVAEGTTNGLAQIAAYNQRCPKAKLVLSGYSQGSNIVDNILGGSPGVSSADCQVPTIAGLDPNSAAGKSIAAAIVFGNPLHTPGKAYNVLTGATSNGAGQIVASASQLAGLAAYTSVFHDYCVATDPICAGGNDISTHLNYFDVYTDTAAAWVKSQLLAASTKPSSSSAATSVASTTFVPSPSATSVTAPYPTASGYRNGTTSVFSAPAIPTETITYLVTVPCATINTAELSSFIATYSTPGAPAATAQTTSYAIPTSVSSGASNGTQPTQAVFAGSASSMASSFGLVGLTVVGLIASLL